VEGGGLVLPEPHNPRIPMSRSSDWLFALRTQGPPLTRRPLCFVPETLHFFRGLSLERSQQVIFLMSAIGFNHRHL